MPEQYRSPLAGEIPEMLVQYGSETLMGRLLRKADATLILRRMAEAEKSLRLQHQQVQRLEDRLQKIRADHELSMQYLLRFGVRIGERHHYRQVLEGVARHGGLTLRQAADLARAMTMEECHNVNGGLSESPDSGD